MTPTEISAVADVHGKHKDWASLRKPHEGAWFVNAAMLRGQQHVSYDEIEGKILVPPQSPYSVTVDLNKIRPKHRARMAKFMKNRPRPVVVPASTDYEDLMNARATERLLKYQWERLRLEQRYREARLWASVCSKSYLWLGYDETAIGRVSLTDPITGEETIESAPLGDVTIDTGTAWELYVPDPAISHIGRQREVLRVRSIPTKDAKQRFPAFAEAHPDNAPEKAERPSGQNRMSLLVAGDRTVALSVPPKRDEVYLFEWYVAPCATYPKGRRVTVVGDTLVRDEAELPFGFYDNPTNPYPCVELSDGDAPGQFWGTTFIEQLVPLQRLLNFLIEKVAENVEAVSRPKIVVYRQHQLADGAWTDSAGEVVELTYVPGLPDPKIIQAAPVSGDIWNLINVVLAQFDEISQIYRASEGSGSGQESGYQTSLLQEATDAVHAPDIRADELAIEDLAWKIRRIVKLTYDVPRLIAVGGDTSAPEMLEFSAQQIDDAAEVRIQIGSMLPDLKAAKAQTMLQMYKDGLLGDPADPLVKRRALSLMEMGGYEVLNEEERLDEAEADRENVAHKRGEPFQPAQFYHHHQLHAWKHEAFMKKPDWKTMPVAVQINHVAHLITHYDFLNPAFAMGLRQQYNLLNLPVATPPPPPALPMSPIPGMTAPAPTNLAPPPAQTSGTPAMPPPQTPSLPTA